MKRIKTRQMLKTIATKIANLHADMLNEIIATRDVSLNIREDILRLEKNMSDEIVATRDIVLDLQNYITKLKGEIMTIDILVNKTRLEIPDCINCNKEIPTVGIMKPGGIWCVPCIDESNKHKTTNNHMKPIKLDLQHKMKAILKQKGKHE